MPPSCALLGGIAIGARVAVLWQHYENGWQSAVVIRQAHRTQCHALRMPAKTDLSVGETKLLVVVVVVAVVVCCDVLLENKVTC